MSVSDTFGHGGMYNMTIIIITLQYLFQLACYYFLKYYYYDVDISLLIIIVI